MSVSRKPRIVKARKEVHLDKIEMKLFIRRAEPRRELDRINKGVRNKKQKKGEGNKKLRKDNGRKTEERQTLKQGTLQ